MPRINCTTSRRRGIGIERSWLTILSDHRVSSAPKGTEAEASCATRRILSTFSPFIIAMRLKRSLQIHVVGYMYIEYCRWQDVETLMKSRSLIRMAKGHLVAADLKSCQRLISVSNQRSGFVSPTMMLWTRNDYLQSVHEAHLGVRLCNSSLSRSL